jgi:hypothetical protein
MFIKSCPNSTAVAKETNHMDYKIIGDAGRKDSAERKV